MNVFIRAVVLYFTMFFSIPAAFAASNLSINKTHPPLAKKNVAKHPLLTAEKMRNHFDIIGAVGIAGLNSGNSELGVTSSETDKLVQTSSNNWNIFEVQLGGGYVYYFRDISPYSDQTQWFPSIEPELNIYHLSNHNIKGDVWRFDSPDFNDLTYVIPFDSTRLMFDAALTVVSRKQLSLYVIGGLGSAWNRLGYSDTDKDSSSCDNEGLNLDSNTHSNFAWEAGVGLTYAFNEHVGLSVEYLYTNLGSGETSASGNTGDITVPIIVPAHFNLRTQAALLSLHIAV